MVDSPPVLDRPDVGGTGMSRKMMGLPAWGWIAITAAGGIVLYVWLQSRKKNAAAATTDTSSPGADAVSSQYASDVNQELLSTIRDLQGQNSTPAPTPAALGAPTGLHVTGTYSNHINLVWDPVAGAVGYDIEWTDQKGAKGSSTTLMPGYMLANLPRGYRYTVRVRARPGPNSTASGAWSSPVTASTTK